jgi:4-amino-4-deoxy-L-arabinose transferase-like glycosyltransferase
MEAPSRTPDGVGLASIGSTPIPGAQVHRQSRARSSGPVSVTQVVVRRHALWLTLLVAGAVLVSFYRLGAGSLWDQDEALYAQMSREILQTGDWITLHIDGSPWYVHPPLAMWLVAATARLAGWSEFTVRFWSAAATVVMVVVTVLLGQRLFTRRTGLLAGAILATTFQLLVQSHLVVFDTVLLAWMLLAVYAFVRAYQGGRRVDYLWFFLCAGLATLTKGPIGLLLPALVIVPFVTLRRAWHRWREVPWAAGVALYVVVGLSWYAVETWLHGWAFASPVFGYYGVGRFFGVVEYQTGPWYFYAPVLVLGAFPWTAFWPAAVAYHARRLEVDGSLFVALWCMITLVFYSLAGTKIPNYILPVYPFAAIGVAALWDAALEAPGVGRGLGVSLVLLIALLGALVAGLARYFAGLYRGAGASLARLVHSQGMGHAVVVPAALLVLGLAVTAAVMSARAKLPAFVALCLTVMVTWLGVLTWVLPVLDSQKAVEPVALAIRARVRPGDRIIGYGFWSAALIYYTDHHVDWVSRAAALRAAVCAPGRAFVVAHTQGLAGLRGTLPPGLTRVAARDGLRVLLKPDSVRCRRPSHPLRGQAATGWMNGRRDADRAMASNGGSTKDGTIYSDRIGRRALRRRQTP